MSGAAEALGVSRATVRRRLAALEARVGTELAQSTDAGVELLPAGVMFVREAAAHVRELDALAEAVSELGEVPRGCLDLSITAGAASPMGPRFARLLRERHPALSLRIRTSTDPVGELERGADLAFVYRLPAGGSYRTRAIGSVRLGLYACEGYVAEHGLPRTVAELKERACLHTISSAELSRRGEAGPGAWPLQRGGTFAFEPAIASPDSAFIRGCVVEGMGIGLLPHLLADGLQPVLPRRVGTTERIWAVCTQARWMLPRVSACLELASSLLGL